LQVSVVKLGLVVETLIVVESIVMALPI
jgi:hypothetical protein